MRASDVVERFWRAKPCRLGLRDRVSVEGHIVSYLLWGHEIARWNGETSILEVDDCGWRTWLTKDRLNKILWKISKLIYSTRRRWCIHDFKKGESYIWEGRHIIHLQTGTIEPARPRITRPKISRGLRDYYERAFNKLEAKRRMFIVPTLDGTAYIFVEEPRRQMRTLVVKTYSPEFDVWDGELKPSTILSTFAENVPERILRTVGKNLRKVDEVCKLEHLIEGLTEMGFALEELPEGLVSTLATAKILEG
jgi:hypothetical protein